MPETDSESTGEADGTDYSWDVKLACRKDTIKLRVVGRGLRDREPPEEIAWPLPRE